MFLDELYALIIIGMSRTGISRTISEFVQYMIRLEWEVSPVGELRIGGKGGILKGIMQGKCCQKFFWVERIYLIEICYLQLICTIYFHCFFFFSSGFVYTKVFLIGVFLAL